MNEDLPPHLRDKPIGQHTIVLPLVELIETLLTDTHNHPKHYIELPRILADIIYAKCQNKVLCYVQFPGPDEVDYRFSTINECRLWDLDAWRFSLEKQNRARARSERERVLRVIREENVKRVAKALRRFTNSALPWDNCVVVASGMVDRVEMDKITRLGISKLIEKEDEL